MERYFENGEQIFKEYCSTGGNKPTMLPRAPVQPFVDIDIYPNEYYPGISFRGDKRRQLDYKTEVKMYRALEKVDGNSIVLYRFGYTHHQYRLCAGKNHNRKGCPQCKNAGDKEGECDFLIICDGIFIVIVVKNIGNVGEVLKLRVLNRMFRNSVYQRNKVVDLIRCIDQDARILQFTAYPNFSKQFKEEFQLSEMTESRLSDDELTTVIFEEDLFIFNAWWADNVSQAISSQLVRRVSEETVSISTEMPISGLNQDSHEKARNILLAIWATERDTCDKSKCSLGQCIVDINKQLNEGQITFKPRKGRIRDKNPDVVTAPDVISTYVGILNLTKEQSAVFERDENLLWINGPAEAGRTVILCGKLLQLLQSDRDSKVVLFKYNGEGNNSQVYQKALDNSNILYEVINYRDFDDRVAESSCPVIIIEITRYLHVQQLTERLSGVKDRHLFLDDVQVTWYRSTAEECTDLIDLLLELSSNRFVWIGCDFAQAWVFLGPKYTIDFAYVLVSKLSTSQRVNLSKSLRISTDLYNILYVIRDTFIRLSSFIKSERFNDLLLEIVSPDLAQGHLIHGPIPIIHAFNNFDIGLIGNQFNIELDEMCKLHEMNYSDIGIIYNDDSRDIRILIKHSVDADIDICHSRKSFSAEWPAVIILHKVCRNIEKDLTTLQLEISRARVYCSVLLYPEKGKDLGDYGHISDILDKLKDRARILKY